MHLSRGGSKGTGTPHIKVDRQMECKELPRKASLGGPLGESGLSPNMRGLVYLSLSAVSFSFVGVFVKGVDAGSWSVIFWRAVFALMLLGIFYSVNGRLLDQLRMSPSGIIITLVQVISTAAFIASFRYTSIANVVVIYASIPLFAALLGWLVAKEAVSRREVVASVAALLGVGVVVNGSLGHYNLFGDFLAVVMAITFALIIVLFRKFPSTSSGGVIMLSCAVLMPICVIFGNPFSTSIDDIFILAVFAFLSIFAFMMLQEGAKLLSPTRTALLSILETPLAPIWAWLILSEAPALSTVVGGVIVIFAVVGASTKSPPRTKV